jgi:DNA polymerase-3 subunit beta
MSTTLVIDPTPLLALKVIAPTNDVRYYLNGIALEVFKREARLVATDGHRVLVHRLEQDHEDLAAPIKIIIPLALLASIKKKGVVEIVIGDAETYSEVSNVTVTQLGVTVSGRTIDGQLPDWRRVIPAGEPSGQPAQFNAEYLGDLAKIYKLLYPGKTPRVAIAHNGMDTARFDLERDDYFGLIAPMRLEPPSGTTPAWVTYE